VDKKEINTSSFECSNSKNSGVMVALASLDLTGKTNNDVSPKLCGNVLYICTTRNGPRHQNMEQPKNSLWSYTVKINTLKTLWLKFPG
jgi:hypothetical protein